jgi:hypothetical protein
MPLKLYPPWRDETSATPEVEALRALKPALLRPKGAARGLIVGITTPE